MGTYGCIEEKLSICFNHNIFFKLLNTLNFLDNSPLQMKLYRIYYCLWISHQYRITIPNLEQKKSKSALRHTLELQSETENVNFQGLVIRR